MLTKAEIKFVKSLHNKKNRLQEQLFIVEGPKVVADFLKSNYNCKQVFALKDWVRLYKTLVPAEVMLIEVSPPELQSISIQKTSNDVLAVFEQIVFEKSVSTGFEIILDNINDPGNLGTIIRIAHWFGAKQIVCSNTTVECYNPKVVQASMGTLAYMPIIYTDLENYLHQCTHNKKPIYGMLLAGKNIYKEKLKKDAALLMGSESHGINITLQQFITTPLNIPSFNNNLQTDSLNVAVATSIACSQIMGNI